MEKRGPKDVIFDPGKPHVQDATDDLLNKRYLNDVGHNAIIQREKIENDRTDQLKEVLKDIGKDYLEHTSAIPKGMVYKGSVAVHIYLAPNIGQVAYASQIALNECPEPLAGPAVSDLRGAMLEYYNHRRQKKRTGF